MWRTPAHRDADRFCPAAASPPNGAIASALHAITLLTTRQLVAELDGLGESAESHILPAEGPLGASPFDFSRSSELLERAYRNTVRWMDEGGLNRAVTRTAYRMPKHAARAAPKNLSIPIQADVAHGALRLAPPAQAFGAT
jgi:hypothetical protein